jgi:phosphoribosylcarboxyaminoimidazole (NCAIR) mutase
MRIFFGSHSDFQHLEQYPTMLEEYTVKYSMECVNIVLDLKANRSRLKILHPE